MTRAISCISRVGPRLTVSAASLRAGRAAGLRGCPVLLDARELSLALNKQTSPSVPRSSGFSACPWGRDEVPNGDSEHVPDPGATLGLSCPGQDFLLTECWHCCFTVPWTRSTVSEAAIVITPVLQRKLWPRWGKGTAPAGKWRSWDCDPNISDSSSSPTGCYRATSRCLMVLAHVPGQRTPWHSQDLVSLWYTHRTWPLRSVGHGS